MVTQKAHNPFVKRQREPCHTQTAYFGRQVLPVMMNNPQVAACIYGLFAPFKFSALSEKTLNFEATCRPTKRESASRQNFSDGRNPDSTHLTLVFVFPFLSGVISIKGYPKIPSQSTDCRV